MAGPELFDNTFHAWLEANGVIFDEPLTAPPLPLHHRPERTQDRHGRTTGLGWPQATRPGHLRVPGPRRQRHRQRGNMRQHNVRNEPFYRRGRVVATPEDMDQAQQRHHGQTVVRGATSDRPYNALDAAYLGQEDYRDDKPEASFDLFERRVRNTTGMRLMALDDDQLPLLYRAYRRAYAGVLGVVAGDA